MQMGNVVAAVKVVINEDLPVAVEAVRATFEEAYRREIQRRYALHQSAQEIHQRRGLRVETHKDKRFPHFYAHRNQSVPRAVERAHALKLRCTLQCAV